MLCRAALRLAALIRQFAADKSSGSGPSRVQRVAYIVGYEDASPWEGWSDADLAAARTRLAAYVPRRGRLAVVAG